MQPDDLESAKKEVQYLQRLNHPNVIRIIDKFENDLTIIIVLPLFNSDLHDYLYGRLEPLDEEEAKRVFKMIA